MAKTDITRQKIKSKISAIKKINDNPKSLIDNVFDPYKDDLSSTTGMVKKNITDFTSKLKGSVQNKKDIFGEIIDTVEGFMGSDKEININSKSNSLVKRKLIKYATEAANKTLQSSKQIIIDETKKAFFGGTGVCASNTLFDGGTVYLRPSAFDLTNMLKVDPVSTSGKLMYENPTDIGIGDVKFNRTLYSAFDSSVPNFMTKDNVQLFSLAWDSGDQKYIVTPTEMKISDFFNGYYNTIEHPNIGYVMQTAMFMMLQGDGTEPNSFNVGMEDINRLIQKLSSICGSPTSSQPLLNNTSNQLTEDEYDIQNYFDFDDIEGIDLDDEDARKRRVLKFRDCDNFEIPINSNHMEDFVYLLNKKTMDENITTTINKTASDAYEQSDGSITLDMFQLSLNGSYILKLPKAIIASVLSPKMIFPISLVYQSLKNENLNVKSLMKIICNLFFNIVKSIFWKFIKEFWGFVKKDLLNFIKEIAITIVMNKIKRLRTIILALITLLTKILETGIRSCSEIFGVILQTINGAINAPVKIPIPGLLLVLSEKLPGFSTDRAYMNINERLQSAGVNMNPLYGTENKLNTIIKCIVDGHTDEMDANSFVKIALKPGIIPSGPGGSVVSPLVEGVGKVF